MPTLTTTPITTLGEFTAFVEGQLPGTSDPLWYRGTGRSSYELKPSLYRHPTVTGADELLRLEKEILARFRLRSIPFLQRTPRDEWDTVFIMQHYAVPTRLLDWTENPYIGLYFALSSAPFEFNAGTFVYGEDAAVWVLRPHAWNDHALSHLRPPHGILSPPDKKLNGYDPKAAIEDMNDKPVAIYGAHNSARIVAQRGAFTIFGTNLNAMESIYEAEGFPQDSLMKLIIPAAHISILLNSLVRSGFTDSVVYPDLEGLAREIKRHFEFPVR